MRRFVVGVRLYSNPRFRDRGMVTAEFAAAMPAVMLMMCMSLGVVGAVATQLRCEHTAYTAARAIARGEDESVASADSIPGARLHTVVEGDRVRVTLQAEVAILGTRLPGIRVSASSVAVNESIPDSL